MLYVLYYIAIDFPEPAELSFCGRKLFFVAVTREEANKYCTFVQQNSVKVSNRGLRK